MKSTFPGLPTEIGTTKEVAQAQRVLHKEFNRVISMLNSVQHQLDNLSSLCGDLIATQSAYYYSAVQTERKDDEHFATTPDLCTLLILLSDYYEYTEYLTNRIIESKTEYL